MLPAAAGQLLMSALLVPRSLAIWHIVLLAEAHLDAQDIKSAARQPVSSMLWHSAGVSVFTVPAFRTIRAALEDAAVSFW